MTRRLGLLLLSTLLVSTLSAQFGGRSITPSGGGARGGAAPLSRGPSLSPSPSPGRPSAVPRTLRTPTQIPRPAGSPSQALSPMDECPTPVSDGSSRPLTPVSPTLDSVSADPEEKARALKAAREFRAMKLPGKEAATAVRRLLTLRWHKKLRDAAYKARADNKPILWIQALGDLRGYT